MNNPSATGIAQNGNYVRLDHGNGLTTYSCHLEQIFVQMNEPVKQGQVIGIMGNTGYSFGRHLHFGVKLNNVAVEPLDYIDASNPRPSYTAGASGALGTWIARIEGGTEYIHGDTWEVFDPAGPGDNTMNLACGMVIADYNGAASWYPSIIPGPITAGMQVSSSVAEQIMEIKFQSFNDKIEEKCIQYNISSLTTYQHDAIFSLIYRLGASRADNALSAYASGGNAGLWNYMKDTYHPDPSYALGTKIRLAEEYELFVKGDYNYNPPTYSSPVKYNQYCNDPNSV